MATHYESIKPGSELPCRYHNRTPGPPPILVDRLRSVSFFDLIEKPEKILVRFVKTTTLDCLST
jgi:hypothetical protein